MTFYGYILLCSFAGPFALSFDKRVAFYTKWKSLFPAVLIVAVPFLVWDALFVKMGVWGFNKKYTSDIAFYRLPLEEILFFSVVPYCCVFVHEVIRSYFEKWNFLLISRIVLVLLSLLGIYLLVIGNNNWYTSLACVIALIFILLLFTVWRQHLEQVGISYLVCLLPFFVVNGLLTGMASNEPVVWYSETEITEIRLGTIPVEDLFYNLAMLVPTLLIYEKLESLRNKKASVN